uniref:Si:dkey-88l16.3 n=1 Tax=Myripristis murdjan TaxID=586833 RepID=A0A668ATG4_9TELE
STPLKCGLGSKLCQDGSECVRYSHVCDGERDCRDGSDEEDCALECSEGTVFVSSDTAWHNWPVLNFCLGGNHCSSVFIMSITASNHTGQFQCSHGQKCIDQVQVCDGTPHCQDRSDELDCMTQTEGCVHQCDNRSRCLPATFLCDGEQDCSDGSDEANCEDKEATQNKKHSEETSDGSTPAAPVSSRPAPIKCSLGSIPCKDNTECVLYSHVCDGEPDCKDGSDERECSSSCQTGQFLCAHGKKCVDQGQVCDGVPHCQDRSDELGCAKRMDGCTHQCDNRSRCLPTSFLCDGERDCSDGSDEANCADVGCNTSEFTCTSGQCVSATMRCDGHPDCWDRSDEENCTKPPVCSTKHRCPQSKECLVQEWICDGDHDCKDGSDEKDCPVASLNCGQFQWACASKTKCIPAAWKCDGMKDCDDGSDETECGAVTCLPHQFQCGSQECLEPALMCNGITNCADGSDEGGSCQIKCAEPENTRCSQSCYSTPQGTRCGCAAGFRLMEDGVSCVDVDECEGRSPGVCNQVCINTPGSYQCQCHPGYAMEADGHRCKITGEPFLLASVQTDFFLFGLRSGSLEVLSSPAKKAILSLDYDWKEQKVFWASLDSESIRWSSLDQRTRGTLIRGWSDSVAVDWIGRNLYWIDGVSSHIVAVRLNTNSAKPLEYSIILDEDLDQPRSLALLPQRGIMFWTEIGNDVKIERAGMDGSERKAVVNSSLGWPGGVAVDIISDRVYWTDERLKAIGSATLDGDDIQILQMKETTNPFSLAVLNDILYWSDAKRRTVQAAHKITGKNHQVLLKRPRQPFGVKIVHPLLQLGTESPCDKMDCSHLCVLAPGPKAVCKCPSGLLLAEDGLTCSSLVNTAFLLILSPSTVTQIYLQARHTAAELKGWPEHLALQVPNVNEAAILDYSLRDHTLFLTDRGTTSLGLFKLKDVDLISQGQLLKLLGDTITAMALDWITRNVYWSSTKQPRLQVTSATGVHTAVVIRDDIGGLESIALHPPSGRVCLINVGLQGTGTLATVECAHMDGAERRVVWKDAAQPTSLIFSNKGDQIYWADTSSGTISSVQLDGSEYKEFKAGSGLAALALSDDLLLWVTARLWYRDEQQQTKLWFEVSTQVVSLKAYSKSSQTGSNQCSVNNGNCQHLCLATPGGRMCKCAHDHILVNATHCVLGQRCPTGSRPCLDGLACHPVEKFCNRHVDCPDHSDENCVHLKQGSGAKATAPTQPQPTSSSPPPLSDAAGLNTTNSLNVSGLLRNLNAQQCSQSRCSGSGRCVESNGDTSCVCLLGYSGDSCQDHLLKNFQGPIVYGAAGICVAVVVIAIVTVVIKRKKNINTRFL